MHASLYTDIISTNLLALLVPFVVCWGRRQSFQDQLVGSQGKVEEVVAGYS